MESEQRRLRAAYAAREAASGQRERYSLFNPTQLFFVQQRSREVLALLRHAGFEDLSFLRLLEIGCGSGGVLIEFLGYGLFGGYAHGIDLLEDRLQAARRRLAGLSLQCADGQYLPYPASSFDLVLQFTAFSSILDPGIRSRAASEMMRVLHKPQGCIMWYDFWLNPTNPQTRGVRPAEVRQLFPDCQIQFRRVTLAPPLARLIVPISWQLAELLEKARLFNSHFLALIRPRA